jgi:hypothetical protein
MGVRAVLSFVAAGSLATGLVALAGVALGGLMAGAFGIYNQRKTRDAAALAWLKDTRRHIYGQSLERAQAYLIACEALKDSPGDAKLRDKVEAVHSQFFETYGVIQVIAERQLVKAARDYAYRLEELKKELDGKGVFDPDASFKDRTAAVSKADAFFWEVARCVRRARHTAIDKMRDEMSLDASDWPDDATYNPFLGTDLEEAYQRLNMEQQAEASAQA